MKVKGIHYSFEGMHWIRKNLKEIRKDLKMIKNDLGANAVKLNGYDDHVFKIAKIAKSVDLQVWLHPQFIAIPNRTLLTKVEFRKLVTNFAKKAKKYNIDVFGIGNELSVEIRDMYLPLCKKYEEKVSKFQRLLKEFNRSPQRFSKYIDELLVIVRRYFTGMVTYFSGHWEWKFVDWSKFDIISCNIFYNVESKPWYFRVLNTLKSFGKPLVIGEFGYLTIKNSFKLGLNWVAAESGKYEYCENTQAKLLLKNLKILEENNIDGGFIHTWDEVFDTCFGIVKKDGTPKKAYEAIKKFWSIN